MSDDLVSVIVPTYNRAYCVCRAIESVCAQSHTNWELLLVDDGSTDNTAQLIASRYGNDPRIRYIYQANAGVSAARNTGIKATLGNFIAFLDSDDAWRPWKLSVQLACFRTFPEVGMVWTEFEAVDATGKMVKPRYLRTMYGSYRYFPTPESLFSTSRPVSDIVGTDPGFDEFDPSRRAYAGNIYTSMLRGNLVHTSTVMLSRKRLEKVQGFDVGLVLSGEDYDFHFRTCKWGSVCFLDLPSTIYQLGYEDRLTKHMLKLAENFLKTVEKAVALEKNTNQFPPAMVHEVLAQAHGWIAEELFRSKQFSGTRHHAACSIKNQLWQPRMAILFCAALVPSAALDSLLNLYRRAKSWLRPK